MDKLLLLILFVIMGYLLVSNYKLQQMKEGMSGGLSKGMMDFVNWLQTSNKFVDLQNFLSSTTATADKVEFNKPFTFGETVGFSKPVNYDSNVQFSKPVVFNGLITATAGGTFTVGNGNTTGMYIFEDQYKSGKVRIGSVGTLPGIYAEDNKTLQIGGGQGGVQIFDNGKMATGSLTVTGSIVNTDNLTCNGVITGGQAIIAPTVYSGYAGNAGVTLMTDGSIWTKKRSSAIA
jgi:hypothetical protein